jgi:hypothetical protein
MVLHVAADDGAIEDVESCDSTEPQPGLPMEPGRAETMTHDYKR